MGNFENVTVVQKANIYYGGKVSSRTVLFADGTKKTLGIILPGEYQFSTAEQEHMEMLAGSLDVLLPGSNGWVTYAAGQAFDIPANSAFTVLAKEVADYCCAYISAK